MPLINKEPKRMGNIVVTEFVDSVGTDEVTFTFLNSTEHDTFQLYNISPKELVVTVGAQVQNVPAYQVVKISEAYSSFKIKALSGVGGFRATCSYEDSDEEDEVILGDRINQLTTQLAQKANQTDLSPKADKTYVDGELAKKANTTDLTTKADKTYVDTQVQVVASGSPKGTYATLAALQAAFPTGNTNIYLVTADGKWYYWSGSAWTAGGTYQSTGIANKSILPNHLAYSPVLNGNLFNASDTDLLTGYFIDSTSGNSVANSNYNSSGFINVGANAYLTFKGNVSSLGFRYVNFYDVNKNWLSGISSSDQSLKSFTMPTNCQYVRVSYNVAHNNNITIKEVNITASDIGLGNVNNTADIDKPVSTAQATAILNAQNNAIPSNGSVTPVKTTFLNASKNLYNKNTRTLNYFQNSANPASNTSYDLSDYIPVSSGVSYVGNAGTRQVAFFDANKNYVSTLYDVSGSPTVPVTITAPNNGYVRVTIYKAYVLAYQFEQGTVSTDYAAWGYSLSSDVSIKRSDIPSQLANKTMYGFGDSIMYGHVAGISCLDYISQNEGMFLTKYAVNGYTVIGSSSVGTSILREIANASSTVPDFVLFDGLANDAYTTVTNDSTKLGSITSGYSSTLDETTFCGSFESICKTLMTKYMGAHIIFVAIHKLAGRDLTAQDTLQTLAKKICAKWGIAVVDLYNESGLNTFIDTMRIAYSYDNVDVNGGNTSTGGSGTHPNDVGYKKFYVPLITAKMKNMA